jgi:two-component system, sensor histidine kinase FlrB
LPETQQTLSAEELQRAFSLFNEASGRLSEAYQELEQQAQRLSGELEVANGALRQQYQEKAALSSRLSSLLDALPGGVVVLDELGVVMEINPTAKKLLGEAVLGIPWRDVETYHLKSTPTAGEWCIGAPTGERRLNLTSAAQESGRILLLTDITEAREMQEQLERHKRLSSMGEMAAGLAHQLRTPLASAILYAGNLAREQLGEADRQRFAQKALERLRALERMIQNMLLFLRGAPTMQDNLAVAALLREAHQAVEPQFAALGIDLRVDGGVGLPPIRGNAKALAGVIVNLLENAMQACEAGAHVQARALRAQDRVLIEVSDDGQGMEAAVRERLFEPFFTTRTEGTGLGLAIVQSVVQAHGGHIEVESEKGRGARFRLSFPQAKAGGNT